MSLAVSGAADGRVAGASRNVYQHDAFCDRARERRAMMTHVVLAGTDVLRVVAGPAHAVRCHGPASGATDGSKTSPKSGGGFPYDQLGRDHANLRGSVLVGEPFDEEFRSNNAHLCHVT